MWLLLEVTKNSSHMDRLWGILPNFYGALFLFTSIYFNPENINDQGKKYSVLKSDYKSSARLVLMLCLTLMWGVRICYVFYRRGYYRMDYEDHRWELVSKRFEGRPIAFKIFNLVLMGFIQNWILIGHAMPFWYIQTNTAGGRLDMQQPLNGFDLMLAVFFVVFFLFEYNGDEQQWNFQTKKYQWIADCKAKNDLSKYTPTEIEDFKRGFLVKGLFAYSRHPNYFGEIFCWFTIWAFTLSSQYTAMQADFHFTDLFNYSCFGSLIMLVLFPRSSALTEKIMAKKYTKDYEHYKSQVPMILPSLTAYEVPEAKRD